MRRVAAARAARERDPRLARRLRQERPEQGACLSRAILVLPLVHAGVGGNSTAHFAIFIEFWRFIDKCFFIESSQVSFQDFDEDGSGSLDAAEL